MKKILPFETSQTPSPNSAPKVEPVDLGLSVKWANANLGAAAPEQLGAYFAWGEIEPKSCYSWDTYKWCKGDCKTLTKYCFNAKYGTLDRKTWWLDMDDDAAHVKLGGKWRMPNRENWNELRHDCSWTWTSLNGVFGYLVASKLPGYTDKSIFLPAAGYRNDSYREEVGFRGFYWSSSLYQFNMPYNIPYQALCAILDSHVLRLFTDDRMLGFSIRPIMD